MIDYMPWEFALPVATILWVVWLAQIARAGRNRD